MFKKGFFFFKNEPFAHYLIFGEPRVANRLGQSPKMSNYEQIAHFLSKSLTRYFFAKNKQFTQKTDERIPSPDS